MSEKGLRIGVIGMGYAGFEHYRCAAELPAFDVVTVADSNPIDQTKLVSGIAVYDDWRAMLAHPGLDAVSICTPHHLHGPVAIAALDAGLHVLLEKPLAGDIASARQIVDAARRTKRTLMVEMTHRFYPPVTEARRVVTDGRLGRLYAVEDRIVEQVTTQLPAWMTRRATAGGGVALTNGIHMLDRIAFVCGQAVHFRSGTAGSTAGLGDIEDTCAMMLTLNDNTPVQLLAAWTRGGGAVDDELTLYGSGGTLRIRSWQGWRFDSHDSPGTWHQPYPADSNFQDRVRIAMSLAIEEFAAAVAEQRVPQPDPEDVLLAQELVEEFYRHVGLHGTEP